MTKRAFFLLWLPLGLRLAVPGVAHAGDPAAAQALFLEAKRQMAQGNFAVACAKLEESQRQDAAVGTQLNLADCYEKLGRTASAWELFLEVSSATKGQPAREKVARERASALEPRLARLIINVTGADPNPDAPQAGVVAGRGRAVEVRRDGVAVGRAQWGTAIPVDPGLHVVSASAPGAKPWQASVTLQDDGRTTTMVVPELESAPPSPSGAAQAPPSPATSGGADRDSPAQASQGGKEPSAAVLALTGIGIAGITVGASLGFWSLVKHNDSSGHCVGDTCDAVGVASRDDAIHAGNASTVGFGIGLAALAGAGILWLTATSSKPTSAVRATPIVGPRSAAIGLGGAF
jgi:hypothetical protein